MICEISARGDVTHDIHNCIDGKTDLSGGTPPTPKLILLPCVDQCVFEIVSTLQRIFEKRLFTQHSCFTCPLQRRILKSDGLVGLLFPGPSKHLKALSHLKGHSST